MKTAVPLALFCLALPPAWGHEGHDHGPPPPPVVIDATPRASAESELFELVAVLEAGPRLLLYLDRHASNEPVSGAQLEVESGAFKAVAADLGGGVYAVPGEAFVRPGTHSLTLTVQAGEETDLLAASLAVPEPAKATVAAERDWLPWAAGGAALVVGGGLGWLALRRRGKSARQAVPGAGASAPALSGEGR
ncbi:MAG: RND family efflux transporter MFP subunit [bacterium]|nr:MAG: RND family efflux transporter MFP subunit [bacterium]